MLLGMMIVGESWKRARAQPQRPLKLEEEGDGRRRWVCTLQGPPLNITHGCSQTPSLAATGLWPGLWDRHLSHRGCPAGAVPPGSPTRRERTRGTSRQGERAGESSRHVTTQAAMGMKAFLGPFIF